HARARYLGGRIHLRDLPGWTTVSTSPFTFAGESGGFFVVLRFGAMVGVGTRPEEEDRVLAAVLPLVVPREHSLADESVALEVGDDYHEGVRPDGSIQLRGLDAQRAQVVANALAKSAVLGHYEERVASVFDRVEALATQLHAATVPASSRDLLRQIGESLLIQTHMVGRVEVNEKPEITWDDPELDRLYERLALEFELADRDRALSRKLEVISEVAGTYLELLDTRKSRRLEWYIIILIAVEIVLILWELFGMK
ncbi:MAG: RMD1 family protein, partial [Gemmatimonadota bacterium]|nr:RMD1 family protein [Gemmatimonadota bacterium]